MNISKILKAIRNTRGVTQQEVADFLKISRVAYTRYENNQRQPSLDTIEQLANYFGVGVNIFFYNEYDEDLVLAESLLSELVEDLLRGKKLSEKMQYIADHGEAYEGESDAYLEETQIVYQRYQALRKKIEAFIGLRT